MFWHYDRPWNTFNKFVIVYYKTLGTAFVLLKHLLYLETGVCVFACKILLRNGLKRAYCRVSARLKCQFKC